ncbi:hypothetical protein Dsin_011563 [Dipteronia sinensis]|uniref:Uncharacterized protein n=1 Tax=Dipteronia sinensis TaxID=43782 RepID=A0AAE0AVB7_9ROSI|nr:hypothetical protein Dsin_011563 [Dipteronia sinensis]
MTKQESTSSETEFSDEVVRRLTILLTDVDDDESELSSDQFPIKEEKIEEIMQEFYKELSSSSFTEVDSITPPSTFPSSSPSPWISSISSLPFDGKSESCGASISRWGSTMMAGVYLSENIVGKGCSGVGDHQKMEGCDRWEDPVDEMGGFVGFSRYEADDYDVLERVGSEEADADADAVVGGGWSLSYRDSINGFLSG